MVFSVEKWTLVVFLDFVDLGGFFGPKVDLGGFIPIIYTRKYTHTKKPIFSPSGHDLNEQFIAHAPTNILTRGKYI